MGCALGEVWDVKEYVAGLVVFPMARCSLLERLALTMNRLGMEPTGAQFESSPHLINDVMCARFFCMFKTLILLIKTESLSSKAHVFYALRCI